MNRRVCIKYTKQFDFKISVTPKKLSHLIFLQVPIVHVYTRLNVNTCMLIQINDRFSCINHFYKISAVNVYSPDPILIIFDLSENFVLWIKINVYTCKTIIFITYLIYFIQKETGFETMNLYNFWNRLMKTLLPVSSYEYKWTMG